MARGRWGLTGVALAAAFAPMLLGMGEGAMPMAQGQLAYRVGRYEQAAEIFSKLPDGPEAKYWRGKAAYQMGEGEVAIAQWRQAAATGASGANAALDEAREQMAALSKLLDRYAGLRAASAAGGPGVASDAWGNLARDFDGLASRTGDSPVGRRSQLMAADALARGGDTAAAVRRFEAAKDRHPLVRDWARWRLGQLQPELAAQHWGELIARFPSSPLATEARYALAARANDPVQMAEVVRLGGQGPGAEKARAWLAMRQGPGQAAAVVAYWDAFPEGPHLDEVVPQLDKLSGLSPDLRYRLASYHFFRAEYGQAVRGFATLSSPLALYRKGRAHWGANELDPAVATLKQVAERDAGLAGRAWLTVGQIEAQRGRWSASIEALKQATSRGGEPAVAAHAKLARIYHEQKQTATANQHEAWIMRSAPWSEEATELQWKGFWNALQARRWQDAMVHGRGMAAHNPNHVYGQAAAYWLGRIHERLGQAGEAMSRFRALAGRAPSSYYGWRASFRLAELEGKGADPWFTTRPGRRVEDPPLRWADLLGPRERELLSGAGGTPLPAELQAWPEGVRELLFLRQIEVAEGVAPVGRSPNLKAWLAYMQRRYRDAIRLERGEPRLSFPLAFAPSLLNAAAKHQVDPLLLAALSREESRFDPNIRSYVGATGLAQLMPTTADWVRKQVPEATGPLTDPNTNLLLGSWYLAYTHRTFNGNSMHAVAAYNGGPGSVARWKRQFGGDPDEFVEAITYTETRLYVKKVFSSYWNYVRLYDGGRL